MIDDREEHQPISQGRSNMEGGTSALDVSANQFNRTTSRSLSRYTFDPNLDRQLSLSLQEDHRSNDESEENSKRKSFLKSPLKFLRRKDSSSTITSAQARLKEYNRHSRECGERIARPTSLAYSESVYSVPYSIPDSESVYSVPYSGVRSVRSIRSIPYSESVYSVPYSGVHSIPYSGVHLIPDSESVYSIPDSDSVYSTSPSVFDQRAAAATSLELVQSPNTASFHLVDSLSQSLVQRPKRPQRQPPPVSQSITRPGPPDNRCHSEVVSYERSVSLAKAIMAESARRDAQFTRNLDISEALTANFSMLHGGPYGSTTPSIVVPNPISAWQNVLETASKRISSLEYIKKTHDGRVYWFNTLLFTRPEILRISAYDPKKVARRATNLLLLGLSLPFVLDLSSSNPTDFLKALYALFGEFEAFQLTHPTDGSNAVSISRGRLPQILKRAAHGAGSKMRRTSSSADIGLPISAVSDPSELKSMSNGFSTITPSSGNFAGTEQDLLPGEEYTYLITPSLPFDPDFFEIFTTVCDLLIECMNKIRMMLASPEACPPSVCDAFHKTDLKIRKVMMSGLIKDFEDTSRTSIKTEMAGVGRVVIGGLI